MWHNLAVGLPATFVCEPQEFRDLHSKVVEWVAANKSKSARVKVICMSRAHDISEIPENTLLSPHMKVQFRAERDVILFKMFFSEYIFVNAFSPVMISMIRRVMPSIIAADLCGVQPMTGPTAAIFALRARYRYRRHNHLKMRHMRRLERKA